MAFEYIFEMGFFDSSRFVLFAHSCWGGVRAQFRGGVLIETTEPFDCPQHHKDILWFCADLMLVFLFLFLFLWRMSFSILIGVILNWSDYLRQYRLLYSNVHSANPCPWDHVLPSWDVSSNLFYHCFLTSVLSDSWCCLCLSPLLFESVVDGVFFSFLKICCHYIEMTLEFWSDCLLLFLR